MRGSILEIVAGIKCCEMEIVVGSFLSDYSQEPWIQAEQTKAINAKRNFPRKIPRKQLPVKNNHDIRKWFKTSTTISSKTAKETEESKVVVADWLFFTLLYVLLL